MEYRCFYHKYLKHCFFYNEKTQDLDETGIIADDNIQFDGKKHFRCTTKHLTSFTAGNYYDPNNKGLSGWTIFLIVLGVVLLIAILVLIVIVIKKKSAHNDIEELTKSEGKMELMS